MARNLYDLDDRQSGQTDSWLQEKQDGRARVLPVGSMLLALLLAAALAFVMQDLLPGAGQPDIHAPTLVNEQFALCDDDMRSPCVLSPNEYRLQGRSYRLADISAPSLAQPRCPAEGTLAARGRIALLGMLNGGSLEAARDPADPDPRARLLRRDGVSLGTLMIAKGLAKSWSATPIDWCKT
jgi:endonuclease YncB( thermonuclease family)